MSSHAYTSILKDEIIKFMEMRNSQGFNDRHRYILISLDKYLVSQCFTSKLLTAKVIDGWLLSACPGRSTSTRHNYIGYYNSFAKYLRSLGYDVFMLESVRVRSTYIPYIFSAEEIVEIFAVADSIDLSKWVMAQLQFSMLLRILYGCGLRLGEALNLRKSNVDVENGVLYIRNAKGNRDRFVPMDSTLTTILSQYHSRLLHDKPDNAWVFESDMAGKSNNCIGKPRTLKWAHQNFRRILKKANVELPILPQGQRNICLHCLRHTFIVRSFRKQDLAGIDNNDPTASISIYVGHCNLVGTQHYLHMTAENAMDIINVTNQYSKGMFPVMLDETSNGDGKTETLYFRLEAEAVQDELVNESSKGMFPEVPQ